MLDLAIDLSDGLQTFAETLGSLHQLLESLPFPLITCFGVRECLFLGQLDLVSTSLTQVSFQFCLQIF